MDIPVITNLLAQLAKIHDDLSRLQDEGKTLVDQAQVLFADLVQVVHPK